MSGNGQDSLAEDFFEQILAAPSYAAAAPGGDSVFVGDSSFGGGGMPMNLQLGSGSGRPTADASCHHAAIPSAAAGYRGMSMSMPLGLNLEQGFLKHNSDASSSGISTERGSVHNFTNLFPAFGHMQAPPLRSAAPPLPQQLHHHQHHQSFHSQPTPGPAAAVPHPPAARPRVRARRGQATDPHSIAERLRRERIAERMKALQELVPSANKTDRAAMLDEIVDYVKFLRLQVKVLSMSRLGGAGAVAQLVADAPLSSLEGEGTEGSTSQQAWDKWSTDGTEQQVAKLMEEDVGAAMQFLQSKALCIMPVSLASAIFRAHHQPDMPPALVKPEQNALS